MTFLRNTRTQEFLASRKLEESVFPAKVIDVVPGEIYGVMVIKQWLVEGGEEDYVDLEFKNVEISITLEKEILEYVYVYVSSNRVC